MPSLDLFTGAGSVRTGEAWFDFKSIRSKITPNSLYGISLVYYIDNLLVKTETYGPYLKYTSPNPFIYEKPPLQCFLVTARGRAVHQKHASWKLVVMATH